MPYMWYGYGTGGNELQTASESLGGTPPRTAAVRDFNGDGDVLDTRYFYNGSVTKTYRPGTIAKFNLDLYNNHIELGYWYEKTRHQQTAPYVQIDSAGNVPDLWEADPKYWIKQQDGQPLEFRDWYTRNTVKSPFIQDTIGLFDDKLTIQAGVKHNSYERNFVNSANQGTGAGADYTIDREYAKTLPQPRCDVPLHAGAVGVPQRREERTGAEQHGAVRARHRRHLRERRAAGIHVA